MSQAPGVIKVYTDGSVQKINGVKRAGLGVWWGPRDSRFLMTMIMIFRASFNIIMCIFETILARS